MKPWAKFATGDCLEQLRRLPDESVDLICTDPPYGWSFMGRDWDKAVPSVEVWRECLRVLKPGAFAFIMSGPRQDCLAQMIVRLEAAGFVTHFSYINWVFFTGFPKSMNLSKAADKRAGVEREVVGKYRPPTGQDSNLAQAEGETSDHAPGMFAACRTRTLDITAPATDEAKALDGAYAGCALKPATEPILVVMKPLQHKTYLDQALDNGKGCTWLDDGRIPTASDDAKAMERCNTPGSGQMRGRDPVNTARNSKGSDEAAKPLDTTAGRFPANVLVSPSPKVDVPELLRLQEALKDG